MSDATKSQELRCCLPERPEPSPSGQLNAAHHSSNLSTGPTRGLTAPATRAAGLLLRLLALLAAPTQAQMIRHTSARCLLLILLWPATGSAQTGSLRGSVVDQTALVLPGATVTVRGNGVPRTAYSDEQGIFELAGVAPGTYTLRVSLAGFSDATVEDVTVSGAPLELSPVELQLASFGDTVVVTALRHEVRLIDAPVSTSVISAATLATTSAQNYGDLLRATPGVNVIQLSARDVQVTSRSPGNTLTNSQLVLVDGRSAYLDFFGLVLWDLLPTNFDDVEQIEVVRGPASAVWGANAMTGAVNIITKPPRESVGTTVTLSGGYVDRNDGSGTGRGAGSLFGANATVTRAPNDRVSYRVSAGYFTSDAFARPTGRIPVIDDPRQPGQTVGGAFYPLDSAVAAFGTGFAKPGHQPAEVRRAGRPGAVPWHPDLRGRRGRHGRAYPQRHRAVRHPAGIVSGVRQGDLYAGRPAAAVFHKYPGRSGPEPAAAGSRHRPVHAT